MTPQPDAKKWSRLGALPLDAAAREHILTALRGRRHAVAECWQESLARTSFVPLSGQQVRQHLLAATDQTIAALLAEPFEEESAQVIGTALAELYYGHPEVLGGTLAVLAGMLVADLPAAHLTALQPRLAALVDRVGVGFVVQARDTILAEQETTRTAALNARRHAEEALRASEARFRAMFHGAAVGIGIADAFGRVLETNAAMQAMFGYSGDEMRGMIVTAQFAHPDDATTDWELYQELLSAQRTHFSIEKRFYRRDDRLIWTNLTVSLVRDAAGQPQFVIAMMEDITERKQAEETIKQLNADLERRVLERTAQLTALNQDLAGEVARRTQAEAGRLQLLTQEQAARAEVEAARQRLAFLAEASAALTSSLDYRTTLASVAHLAVPYLADWCAVDVVGDDGVLRRLGVAHVNLAKVELVRALQDYQPPDPDALSGVLRVLRTGQAELLEDMDEVLRAAVAAGEHRQILGELRPVSRITVPLAAREHTLGTITFVLAESGRRFTPTELALAEDLARRIAIAVDNARLYQEVQRALAARDEFLSVAAHEMKTPITNVRGFTELALQQFTRAAGPDLQRVERSLQVLDRESQRLTHLVTQLLDISRIEAGKLALARDASDVAALVREVAASAQLSTKQHAITVQAPASVPALVDPLRLEQVVANLLNNAIKYSPQGGPIAVEVAAPAAAMVRIAVRDWGVGIPPERRSRLFERYYQTRVDDRVAGMGLGLYISRQIVEAHGGRIAVESPPDGGTRMLVDLPTDQAGREDDKGS